MIEIINVSSHKFEDGNILVIKGKDSDAVYLYGDWYDNTYVNISLALETFYKPYETKLLIKYEE